MVKRLRTKFTRPPTSKSTRYGTTKLKIVMVIWPKACPSLYFNADASGINAGTHLETLVASGNSPEHTGHGVMAVTGNDKTPNLDNGPGSSVIWGPTYMLKKDGPSHKTPVGTE